MIDVSLLNLPRRLMSLRCLLSRLQVEVMLRMLWPANNVLPLGTLIKILNNDCYSGHEADVHPQTGARQESDGMFSLSAHYRQTSFHIIGIPDKGNIVVIFSPSLGCGKSHLIQKKSCLGLSLVSYRGRIKFVSP